MSLKASLLHAAAMTIVFVAGGWTGFHVASERYIYLPSPGSQGNLPLPPPAERLDVLAARMALWETLDRTGTWAVECDKGTRQWECRALDRYYDWQEVYLTGRDPEITGPHLPDCLGHGNQQLWAKRIHINPGRLATWVAVSGSGVVVLTNAAGEQRYYSSWQDGRILAQRIEEVD